MTLFGIDLPPHLTTHLFSGAYVIAATAVTVHVLLHKRDVRAAIGWIGLAWLSPAIGVILYYVMGINRVARRASRLGSRIVPAKALAQAFGVAAHRLPKNIAIIAAVGERVTGRPLISGNAVSILHGGDTAYPAMVAAIRGARRSVALASYIFRVDSAGSSFVAALTEARSRGVEIRVLVDGIGSGYFFSPIVRRLTKEGIAVRRFLHDWLPWQMPFLNMRSHKKILVVDGAIGFTGGLNIGAENLHEPRPAHPVDDIHFRVEGPVVGQLMQTFAEDWNFTTGERLDGDVWWPRLGPVGPVLARGIKSGPDEDIGKLETVLATAVAAARHRLRIVTPYFLPDQHLMSNIAAAALGGVEVDIVLPEYSDWLVLDWAMRAHLAFFANSGVRLHLAPSPFDHAKLTTVDGCWCLVGSANWDARSTRLNFEFNLECYDEAMVSEIDRMIDAKIARSHAGSPEAFAARPIPLRLRDAGARLFLPYL